MCDPETGYMCWEPPDPMTPEEEELLEQHIQRLLDEQSRLDMDSEGGINGEG